MTGSAVAGGNLLMRDSNDASAHFETLRQDIQLPVRWYLSSDGLPGSGLSNGQLQTLLQNAFDTWEQLPSSRIQFEYAGEIDRNRGGIDGVNLITFTDQSYIFPSGVLAVAATYTFTQETTVSDANNDLDGDGTPDIPNGVYPAGSIYEADIIFNASYDFTTTGDAGSIDLQAVALHEIGHSVGLSHTIIDGAVMHPFLSQDVLSARIPKADDIAFISYLYPEQPAYSSDYGSISGAIVNGLNNQRILGAHVYAVDPASGQKIVGAFSLEQGDFLIPGLAPGNYYIGIEPLDSDPLAADPARINAVIEHTFDTRFAEEFYDSNESNIETDATNAQLVTVAAGADSPDINITTNTVEVPGVSLLLRSGLNLFAYPVETPEGFTAFDLLAALGDDNEINSIDRYDSASGRYQRTAWVNGVAAGENFPIKRGEAYLVHMAVQKVVTFRGTQNCPTVDVGHGFNLVGVACPPAGYSAYDLLDSLPTARRVLRYNPDSTDFEIADYDENQQHRGVDFNIVNGEGYVIETQGADTDVLLPGRDQLFPPFISGVSPGRATIGSTVLIMGQGFADQAADNAVTFNGVRAAVTYSSGDTLTVTVPAAATSGPVTVTVNGRVSNAVDFVIENSIISEQDAANQDLISGQTVQGSLDAEGEQDRYSFIATKGSLITAWAQSVAAGVPDLLLALEGPYGALLTSDDNSYGGTNPWINRFEAPTTGRYTLVVTQVPGSGVGPYSFNLNIEHVSSSQEINVLSGDFQTGLMGTRLPVPLEVLVTGITGDAVAGTPVTLVTDDNLQVTGGFTAASHTVVTNGSGIATVTIDLPDNPGQYSIVIQIPGFPSRTISVASLQRLPAFVEKTGDNQNCGGDGCPVDTDLPEPYQLRFLDSDSQPLEGVLTKFVVVSGDGSIQGADADTGELTPSSDASGVVQATHRLGQQLLHDGSRLPIPQIVAAVASIPNSSGPILFQSTAKAGDPARMESRTTSFNRMTMGTARLNAVFVEVYDAFDNPVKDAPVTMNASGGLQTAPGVLNGEVFQTMATNERGEFVGMVSAGGVQPTKDELGADTGVSAYNVSVSVPGASGSQNYQVEVDMGPDLVGTTDNNGAPSGHKQWVGQVMDRPVVMFMLRYQRTDQCEDLDGNDYDDDSGVWTDEDFNLARIRQVPVPGVLIDFEVRRTDGNGVDGNSLSGTSLVTDAGGYTTLDLTMGESKGGVVVVGRSFNTTRTLLADPFCIGGSLDMAARPTISDITIPAMSNGREFQAVSPRIEVTMDEDIPDPLTSDPLPGRNSYSGIELPALQIMLNGSSIFSGPNPGVVEMNVYPNYIQASFDGAFFNTVDGELIEPLSPGQFTFVYYPKASEVSFGAQNTIEVFNLHDKVGNSGGTDDSGLFEHQFNLPAP